ncbi:hypothetical protein niasHT_009752 [Heterodera trifolii]|uniref:FLYWCH-type domain-containing protein n=1 Tax=Heterodera trifolii TaxID=157864 RepID=A0ABD2M671_9BILA
MEHTNIPEPVSWALTVGPPRLGPHVWAPHVWAPARLGPSTEHGLPQLGAHGWALTVGRSRLGAHVEKHAGAQPCAPKRERPTVSAQPSKLQHDGHLYTFAKTSADGTTKFWRCEYKNSGEDKCKGRFWTSLRDEFIRIATPHTLNGIQVTSLRKKSRLPSKGVLL